MSAVAALVGRLRWVSRYVRQQADRLAQTGERRMLIPVLRDDVRMLDDVATWFEHVGPAIAEWQAAEAAYRPVQERADVHALDWDLIYRHRQARDALIALLREPLPGGSYGGSE